MPIIGRISVGDGATFTPDVTDEGVLTWTNNKNLENPDPVDIAQAVVDKKPGWGIPIGYEYFTINPNIPQGSLPLFGGEYDRATYPDLWAWVQTQTGYLKTEAQWQALSSANGGNVPYYSDGDGSTTFRVPSLKCWIKSANGTVSEVGSYLEAGLPNITGAIVVHGAGTGTGVESTSGAFGHVAEYSQYRVGTLGNATSVAPVNFNASRSNSIYGNSTTVQPPSIVGMWLVKAYGVVEDTGSIDEQQYLDDRMADLKNVYLPANYLQLTGGTISGAIKGNPLTLTADDGNGNTASMVLGADGSALWNENDITPQKVTSETSEDVTLSNNTMKTLHSFSLTKGTWLVIGRGYFASNSTGFRELGFSTSDNGNIMSANAHSVIQAPNGSSVFAQVMYIFSVASTTTYYLVGKQTSGGNLTASGAIVKFRLSSVN